MENHYIELKKIITILDANIYVEELQGYYGFKLAGDRNRRVRSFADVYLRKDFIRIQICNIDYDDPLSMVIPSNNGWTLDKHLIIKTYADIANAIDIIQQSYLYVRGIVNELDEPIIVERGPVDISFIFQKELDGSDLDRIFYETRIENMFSKNFVSCMSLTIDNLIEKELSWRDDSQPNANKLFNGKKAKLLIYHGSQETYEYDSTQSVSLSKESIFISWRIHEIAYITNIIDNLKSQKRLSLKIDIEPDDSYFARESSIYNFGINKISLSFNNWTDKEIEKMISKKTE